MGISTKAILLGGSLLILAGCDGQPLDFDLRDLGNGLDTSSAAQSVTANRPPADDRGVISYPNYQVAVARTGDTVSTVAGRIGLDAASLARHNGLSADTPLRASEILALPSRVSEPSAATGAITTGPLTPGDNLAALAGSAIDRAQASQPGRAPTPAAAQGVEPIRHRVEAGETAFTIARLYDVSVRALSEWNGLGADLSVREGQFLLIPVVIDPPVQTTTIAAPGTGTATPTPPSATTALPDPEPTAAPATPEPAELATTPAASSAMVMPVKGSIIRSFEKGKNDGIDISAPAGASVVAAADGTVAAITRDTDQVPIIVLRHADNVLTVYAGVDNVAVAKGDSVTRGQKIAVIRDASPSFLHFETRRGLDSVDPMEFLN